MGTTQLETLKLLLLLTFAGVSEDYFIISSIQKYLNNIKLLKEREYFLIIMQ